SSDIGKDIIIPDHTVMCNMSFDHEQVMTTNLGQALVLNRATMQTAMLTNLVVIANLKPGFFTGILKILTYLAYTGVLEDFIIFTYTRIATHHHVSMKFATRTNSDIWPDNTIWANFYIRSNDC